MAFIDFQKAYDYVWHDGLFHKMLLRGMIGPLYRVIYSMYESVKSIVKCGNDVSDITVKMVGLRQGCVLSPCLFSLFIADLPTFLSERECKGVFIHDVWLRVLLYADDGALVAESAADLQLILDALYVYCSKWRMIVNVKKTEIMVFNRKRPLDAYRLSYDNKYLSIAQEFKYLGVMFYESRRQGYASCIRHRITKAKQLVAAWKRRCEICLEALLWSDVIVNQFMTCIVPCLEYGASLWRVG